MNAVIYTRVSTDEQADNGYSLDHQFQYLKKYCEIKEINILKHFREDHSAKNFERPEWKKLMEFVKVNKKDVDKIVFTRWDRFSRNHEESLRVIRELQKMGIEVNAAEQPLDLTQPENKLLLAINLVIPEVENDKNRIRTTEGMREAKKQGCWVGTPPFGYKNTRNIEKKSTLEPTENAYLVLEAFNLVSTGLYTCEEVRRIINKKGNVKIQKQPFLNLLNNIAYTGRILVPEMKKEDAFLAQGLHEPIISPDLYDQVQYVLKGRKRQPKVHMKVSDLLPLRGHLICPECGGNLTGSGSTGRKKIKHYYYHCMKKCKVRYRADDTNQKFLSFLLLLKVPDEVRALFLEIMKDIHKKNEGDKDVKIKQIEEELFKAKKRIENAQDKFSDDLISLEDFNSIKKRGNNQVGQLTRELAELKSLDNNFLRYMNFATSLIENLSFFYEKANVEVKQKILGSIFPAKLIYNGKKFRTTQQNEVIALITRKINKSVKEEIKKVGNFADQSSWAPPLGLEPKTP